MADTPPTRQDEHDARVVSAHLPSGYGAAFDGASEEGTQPGTPPRTSSIDMAQNQEESSLKLQGGDIHRALYKIDHRAKLHKRAATFSGPRNNALLDEDDQLTAQEQQLPGGFRRAFVMQRRQDFVAARMPVTRNFVEFLDLYGSFAGEDLADSDDDSTEDSEDADAEGQDERRPLLTKRQSAFRAKQGDASTTKTFFTLLKAFIGTGIMFLPKAFNNGGILFSSMCLVSISMISMLAFHLLLQCRTRYGGGYGDIGNAIGGPKMRAIVLGSITLSQLGFVCAGIVFCAENLYSFSEAVAKGTSPVSSRLLIAFQIVVLIPFSFIRNISKLGPAALLADIFIAVGLVYIYWYDISTLAERGINPTVQLFNPAHYTLTIGSCIFTFEGIGLILPIQSSMSKPQKFEPLLALVMLIITVVFCSVGALCYATFGNDTNIEVINNFPQTSKLVNAVQFLYSIAVLVGNPVQLFPAIRIIEGKLFGHRSGKKDTPTKWKKNGLRTSLVILCGAVSILGAGNLDRFVALIGSFACVPLVYIYPPLLHYKGIAGDKKHALWWKIGDAFLMGLGVVGMIYTTAVTVANSFM